jgi:hypothetical protein
MKLFKSIARFFKGLYLRLQFQRAQGARLVPDKSYFVAPDGSVRRKFPKLHMSKKLRLAQRQPRKLREYVDSSRAALTWAKGEIERKDKALRDVRAAMMGGKGFPAVMDLIREATA